MKECKKSLVLLFDNMQECVVMSHDIICVVNVVDECKVMR